MVDIFMRTYTQPFRRVRSGDQRLISSGVTPSALPLTSGHMIGGHMIGDHMIK